MDDLCTACLCTGRNLFFIGETGSYHLYSQILNEIPVYDFSSVCVRVCWECRALLRRFGEFKALVKRSYSELLQQCHQNEPPSRLSLARAPRLQTAAGVAFGWPDETRVKEEHDDLVVYENGDEVKPLKEEEIHDAPHDEPEVQAYNVHVENDEDQNTGKKKTTKKTAKEKKKKVKSKKKLKAKKVNSKKKTEEVRSVTPEDLDMNVQDNMSDGGVGDTDEIEPDPVTRIEEAEAKETEKVAPRSKKKKEALTAAGQENNPLEETAKKVNAVCGSASGSVVTGTDEERTLGCNQEKDSTAEPDNSIYTSSWPDVPEAVTNASSVGKECVFCHKQFAAKTRSHQLLALRTDTKHHVSIKNVILERLQPEQVRASHYICHPCWQKADRAAKHYSTPSSSAVPRVVLRCVNCNIHLERLRRHVLDDGEILVRVQKQIAPRVATSSDYVCTTCHTLILTDTIDATISEVNNTKTAIDPIVDPIVGHKFVCVVCGKSLAGARCHDVWEEKRRHVVGVVQKWVEPRELEPSHRVCHKCFQRAEAAYKKETTKPEPKPDPPDMVMLPDIKRAPNTHAKCIFPNCTAKFMKSVPLNIRVKLFIYHSFYVPKDCRICSDHLKAELWSELVEGNQNHYFTVEYVDDFEELLKSNKKLNLKNNKKNGADEKPTCEECGKVFSSKKTYRYHLNVLHKGQNRYPCPRCGKVYQWKSNLGRHLRTHKARDSGELYCATCDKRFASVATYRQHLRVSRRHVPESDFSFTCNECGKKFVNKTRLRDHVDWEHLHNIKFRCQLCNKPFKCHTSLYVHLQNVHRNKQKENLCHICGKSYQNAAKLKYHIVAMHTSETPYQCAHCAAAFGWYSSLYRHVREVHYKMKLQPKKMRKPKRASPLPPPAPPHPLHF